MLSIDFIRNNKEKVAEAAQNKNRAFNIDELIHVDDARRTLIASVQALRQQRNSISQAGNTDNTRVEGKKVKEALHAKEEELTDIEKKFNVLMLQVPNIPLDDVPIGKDESANIEIKKWGSVPSFDFTPLSHVELASKHNLIDMERGSKVSGFRGYFLLNQLAILQVALMHFALMKLIGKGFTPVIPPTIVKEYTLFGTGHFPWGRAEDVYQLTQDKDAYLSGTAEIPVTAFHSGETLSEKDLPKKYVALSPCYRREAGTYGRDTKGILRVHEFWKIEQVIIARNNLEEARALHSELQQNTEEIFQDLELPYRVVNVCTGEMGEPQIFKYDTEVWIPSENTYREVASNSILGDFQARRLKIKYKKSGGDTEFCFTLNDTAIASTRPLIAILENFQQKDGSINIPKALRPLTGFDTIKTH